MDEELILIAKIRKPHGLTGEVTLESFTWDESRFTNPGRVFLRTKVGKVTESAIESVRFVAQGMLARFKGCNDRTAAEALTNCDVMIPISERLPLPDGKAYYDEFPGLAVIDAKTNARIGIVKEVIDYPAGDVFVLDLDGEEHMVTSAGEEIVDIDMTKREVRVSLLESISERAVIIRKGASFDAP